MTFLIGTMTGIGVGLAIEKADFKYIPVLVILSLICGSIAVRFIQ